MAEEADKQAEENKEAAPAEGAGGEENAKPKKDVLTLVTLGLAVLNLGILGGMGFFLKKMLSKVTELQERPPVVAELPKIEEESIGKEYEPKQLGTLFPLDGFLVNLAAGDGPRFLQVQMELELEEGSDEGELDRKKAAVRDSIIVLLSSRSYSELRNPRGIKNLRRDLVTTVSNLLSEVNVKDVYFTQFHFN